MHYIILKWYILLVKLNVEIFGIKLKGETFLYKQSIIWEMKNIMII